MVPAAPNAQNITDYITNTSRRGFGRRMGDAYASSAGGLVEQKITTVSKRCTPQRARHSYNGVVYGGPIMRPIFLAIVLLGFPSIVQAQASLCGDPPPVSNKQIEADINGKAQILSKYIGDAALGGKIKESTTEIFSRYPDAGERSRAYFEYQVCVIVMQDKEMSTDQKLEKLVNIRSIFNNINLPSKNTIIVRDATYASRWHPEKRGSIFGHLHDQCENHTECQFACDNHRSGAGDVSRGDPTKRCIVNYSCSRKPLDILNATVGENERGTYPIICPNS